MNGLTVDMRNMDKEYVDGRVCTYMFTKLVGLKENKTVKMLFQEQKMLQRTIGEENLHKMKICGADVDERVLDRDFRVVDTLISVVDRRGVDVDTHNHGIGAPQALLCSFM